MKLLKALPLALLIVSCATGVAFAQSSTAPAPAPPAGGTVTPPAGSTPVNPGAYQPIDLPIEKPIPGRNAPQPPEEPEEPEPPEPPETDPPIDEEPPELYGEELPAEDTIFYVIDVSGSMDWDRQSYVGLDGNTTSGTKLDRAKVELIRSVSNLSENFRFNIIAFDCGTYRWAGSLQSANSRNKAAASGWVNGQYARGATGTGPATALALGERENTTVVLLTDGAPNCGANGIPGHKQMILGSNAQGAKIHTFGIAADGQFRRFLQDVAAATGGRYVDVP